MMPFLTMYALTVSCRAAEKMLHYRGQTNMLNSGWHNFLSVAGALLVGAVGMHMYKEHTDGNVVLDDAAAIVTAICCGDEHHPPQTSLRAGPSNLHRTTDTDCTARRDRTRLLQIMQHFCLTVGVPPRLLQPSSRTVSRCRPNSSS